MYSLTAVGGIQYSTEMAKKTMKGGAKTVSHTRIRDILVGDVASPTGALALLGSGGINITLSPNGIGSYQPVCSATGVECTYNYHQVANAYLPWLKQMSAGYGQYRVTSATLIIIGSTGSTAGGRLTVASSPNCADLAQTITPAAAIGSGAKAMDIAQIASKEIRVPLNIDTSWKSVSFRTNMLLNDMAAKQVCVSIRSIDDIAFTNIAVITTGYTGANQDVVANFALEYTVDFKEPMAPFQNA